MVPVPLPFSNFYSSKLFESLCKRAFEVPWADATTRGCDRCTRCTPALN